MIGRLVGQAMGDILEQPFIVENRPGAGSALGADLVVKSPPDGYAILLGASSTHVLNPLLYKLSYDPVKDFTPLGLIASTPLVLVVGPQLQSNNISDVLLWLKTHSDQANFGSYGNASASHLAGELFKSMSNVNMVHVPYKGAAPALADLMAGHITLMFSDMSAFQYVKSGRLKAIAVTSSKRIESYSDVPTLSEVAPTGSGLEGFQVAGWFAFYLPANTSKVVVDKLNSALMSAMSSADVRNKLINLGLEPGASSPEVLSNLMRVEREKWVKVISTAKIKVE
jgi:tripartite-type tricarboxylate transporter receptor subunit TctC